MLEVCIRTRSVTKRNLVDNLKMAKGIVVKLWYYNFCSFVQYEKCTKPFLNYNGDSLNSKYYIKTFFKKLSSLMLEVESNSLWGYTTSIMVTTMTLPSSNRSEKELKSHF